MNINNGFMNDTQYQDFFSDDMMANFGTTQNQGLGKKTIVIPHMEPGDPEAYPHKQVTNEFDTATNTTVTVVQIHIVVDKTTGQVITGAPNECTFGHYFGGIPSYDVDTGECLCPNHKIQSPGLGRIHSIDKMDRVQEDIIYQQKLREVQRSIQQSLINNPQSMNYSNLPLALPEDYESDDSDYTPGDAFFTGATLGGGVSLLLGINPVLGLIVGGLIALFSRDN